MGGRGDSEPGPAEADRPPSRGRARARRIASLLTRPLRPEHLPAPLRFLIRLASQTLRRWQIDRCTQEAAALAFKTALGLVPLCAVGFTLLKAAGKLDERGAFLEFFAANLFPSEEAGGSVQQAIISFADNLDSGVLGPGGLAILIVVVFLLFRDIESFWNRVWSAASRRSVVRSFTVFYMLATLVPFLVATSLYHTAHYWRGGVVGFFAPAASTFGALLAANKLLPAVKVRWQYAALGAALSAVLFETAKLGFARYVMVVLTNYKSIYGAFGLVPLVLVWIYVAWLTVLLGVELAHAAQRLDALEASGRRRISEGGWELVTGTTAARLMVEIGRHYTNGKKALAMSDLVERLRLPEEAVLRVLERLAERDLAIEVELDGGHGWLPARPPSAIRLDEVLAAFRALGVRASGAGQDRLGLLLDELDPATSIKAQVTLDDLL
ncbi:MAG: YihY family inner membrane protein [Myxococcales bacterium]|nr:YihY family inner membrane protein [Myxococcales bacterium]